MVNRFITLIFSLFVIISAGFVCPPNEDCMLNCNSTFCANQTIQCPTSNSSESYICMISCTDWYVCTGVIIISGTGVSDLIFESFVPNASPDVVIIANGTRNIEVTCNSANACKKMELNVMKAKSVKVSADGTTPSAVSGISKATWNIEETENVEMHFLAFESCYNCTWNLIRNTNVTLLCVNDSSCAANQINVVQSSNVIIRAINPPSVLAMQGTASFKQIKNLIIESSDNAIQREHFSLNNIENFLLSISDTGSALLCSWDVNNVTNVALNSWNVTSIWLVNGMNFQNEYQCDNDKDCNIRIDATNIPNSVQINISCPMKTEATSVSASGPICSFYCSASNGCNTTHLTAVQTPNVQLFFSPSSTSGFSFNADGTGLNEPILNINCTSPNSCYNSRFLATGYENITVTCGAPDSCISSRFNFTNFENAQFDASPYSMMRSVVGLSSGSKVFVASIYGMYYQQAFENAYWSFTDIDRVHVICSQYYDCQETIFESTRVGKISVVCGDGYLRAAQSCSRTRFINNENTSFNLSCDYDQSCENLFISYDGDDQYDTSCVIKCAVSPLNTDGYNCVNTWVYVPNNPLGYYALTLICEDSQNGLYTCDNIMVECGIGDTTCNCYVRYNATEGYWGCNGACGNYLCEDEQSDSDEPIPTAVVVVLVIVGVAFFLFYLFCCYRCCYRRFYYPRPLKTEDRHRLLENQSQISYNT